MTTAVAIVADVACITILTFGLYHRRHGRRDLLLAYLALNTGVLAVTATLTTVQAGIGLGLGLFGILSIIRLRSDQIAQEEIAYYFTSLALGLLAGLHPEPGWLAPAASVGLVAAIAVADHPGLLRRSQRVVLTLDRAYAAEPAVRDAAGAVLGATVPGVTVRRADVLEVDLVRDVTVVDVRYVLPKTGAATAREFALAEAFLRHPDQVLSREQLLSQVWGFDFDPGSNVVDVYVRYLRRKLGEGRIETMRGAGYRLRAGA